MKKLTFILFTFLLINILTAGNILAESKVPWPATISVPKPVSDNCITSPRKGTVDLKCEGLMFTLHVPEICLTKACGLIVDIHGYLMSADLQDYYTDLAERGGNEGYIVVQPTANKGRYGRSWEYGEYNVSKVLAFMNRVKKVFHVMEERVHVTGFSQGSWMTWKFVCDYADEVASVAPIGFGAGWPVNLSKSPVRINTFDDCFKGKQVDILYAHGKRDGIVHYSGALKTVKKIGEEWGMDKSEILFKEKDYQWVRFTNPKGTVFEFISYNWESSGSSFLGSVAGHCFPGVGNYLGCGKKNPFHWGDEVVKFFLKHPKELAN
ncbi:MAG: hypothetical protein QF895_04835 [SAR86 cluster bacterium]|jgi:pimeloyl-ACP methyl ester carboxylesterase|nr:hypothetical protein [SAR86 cluster bacterium]